MPGRMTIAGVGPILWATLGAYFAAALIVQHSFPGVFAVRSIRAVYFVAGGCLLVGIGLPLCVLSVRTVRRAFKRGKLATEGVFSICRHPVYASALVWISGIALFFRSWLLLPVPIVGYVAARLLTRREDAYLEEKFGQEYRDYKQRVNPICPTFRRRRPRGGRQDTPK